MKKLISSPVNEYQERFNQICEDGGGQKHGPTRGKVQALLRDAGQALNQYAYCEIETALDNLPDKDPWHVCFAMGLCWGEMATMDSTFFEAAVGCIEGWNDADRKTARKFCTQKGADLVEGSLRSAFRIFDDVTRFPVGEIPDTLEGLNKAQRSWLRSVDKLQPTYIGPWNATALFMVALFARPDLAASMVTSGPILPPGGPIHRALNLLFQAGTTALPAQSLEDDNRFSALAAATADNGTMQDLLRGLSDCSMVDMHSGLYMIGTRDRRSATLFQGK